MLYTICVSVVLLIYSSKCSRVVDVYTEQALNVSNYCPQIGECGEGSHVMCLYNSVHFIGPSCVDLLTNVTITPDYAGLILGIANRIRSKIANGQVKVSNGQKFPKGYGMFRVVWDEELATFAQVWANQCNFGHDLCRSSKKFPHVAQAVGLIRLSFNDWMPIHNHDFNETTLTPGKLKYALKQVIRAWWDMKEGVLPDDIKLLSQTRAEVLNSNKFLNLIYGPITHIGCGLSVYKEFGYKQTMAATLFNCIQVVCNFSSRPMIGEPIYTVEPPKTPGYTVLCGCPPGYDEDEDCLCYLSGRKELYTCKGKDYCKPPVVVLPIFKVEDAPVIGNRVYFPGGPIVIRSGSDDGILEKSRELYKLYRSKTITLKDKTTNEIFDIKDRHRDNRIPFTNYNDVITNLEAVDHKRDLTRKFPADVKRRYFNPKPKMIPVHNTTKASHLLTDSTHVRRHFAKHKPSIFSKVESFHLPINKRKQVTMNLVNQSKEFKKDVIPRKDFKKVQQLVSNYLAKKRHGKPFDIGFDSDHIMSHGLVLYSDYNSTVKQKLQENKNDINKKVTYLNISNFSKGNLKQNKINLSTEGETKFMSLLDKLEEEVKNIDLNTNEKGMFDAKIRKIYGTLVGKSDLNDPKLKILSKYSANETLTEKNNFHELSEIDQTNGDKYGFSSNKPKYNYPDFENYDSFTNHENKLEKAYGNKFFNSETDSFPRGGNENVKKRKFQNAHNVRKKVKSYHQNRYSRLDDDEYYPLSSERRRYFHEKLVNLQKKIKNMKRSGHPKEVPVDRHIRPVRPTKQENQQRHRKPNDHVNSYYMPDRARFLHGF